MIRQPVMAGQFYPADKTSLEQQLRAFIKDMPKEDAYGAVSPHAGYIYSGAVAGSVLSCMKQKSTYIILGPNHTGRGTVFSVDASTDWVTPLGKIALDSEFIDALLAAPGLFRKDERAHSFEHSIEVQLPFLQMTQKSFTIIPIVVGHAGSAEYIRAGEELASAIKKLKREREVCIIASSDMTHYEPHESAKKKDLKAIEAILRLDETELSEAVQRFNITMCGYAAAYIMLITAKQLGATRARLVQYKTSGETSGDFSSVVGYAGILIS